MSTQGKDRKVHHARARLDELREEAARATTEYQTWLGELVNAVDAQDVASVNDSFDKAFDYGARMRSIIEDEVAVLLGALVQDVPTEKLPEGSKDGIRDFARMRGQMRKAEALVYTLALSSFGRAFYYRSKGEKASLPVDEYPEARFANELSRLACDIIDTLGGPNGTDEIDLGEARSYIRSAEGMVQILAAALGSDHDRYDEQGVAECAGEIIASVARELAINPEYGEEVQP